MKSTLSVLFFLFILNNLVAQEFEVREFKSDPSDIAARRHEKRTVNDEPCALVKITTNIKGMQFDSNIGIVDVVHQVDGYWIYVAPRERRIKLMANGYISLDVDMPEPANSHTVYNLIVVPKGLPPKDLVKITFRINESNVYIRTGESAPVLSVGNNAPYQVTKGTHTFWFIKDGFKEKTLSVDAQKDEIIEVTLEPGGIKPSLALTGWIILTSEPSGAEVFLNEQRVGVTPYQGKNIAGQYSIRLQYPLYHDHIDNFTLNEGATVTIPSINMKPRFGYWKVNTTPADAELLLDGKSVGTAPLARGKISSGNHEITIRKSLYHDHKETFIVSDGDDKNFDITLKKAFGELVITSDPTGAKVFIDEREVGVTPYRNAVQPSGNYSIRLTQDLYSDARDNITVNDGQKTDRFIALSKNFGTLYISASGADIYLNNNKVGSNTYTAKLTPGQYRLKATKDRHIDDERDIFVMLGQSENITLTPKPRQGGLSIATNPFDARGAEIFINNEKQKATTPATIPLLIGNYDVTVKKTGYLDASQSVLIKEGVEQELVFNMQTYQGSMLQVSKKYKNKKRAWGFLTIAAVGAGAYYRYSVANLGDQYKTATTDATEIYDKLERHDLYSYIAFGVAVPCAVMTLVKSSQQKKAEKKANLTFLPTPGGAVVRLAYTF